MSLCLQTARRYHFLKVIPTSPSILNSEGKVFQRKWDGTSAEVFKNGNTNIIGRGITEGKQSDFTAKFPELVADLNNLNLPEETDFLTEIIVVNQATGKEELSLVQGRTGRESNIDLFAKAYPALMIIHDVVSVAGKDVSQLPYFDRINALKSCFTLGKSQRCYFINSSTDGKAKWEHIEKNRLEGLIIRDPKAPLGKGIWKLKRFFTEDVYCKGEYTPADSSLSEVEYEVARQKKKGVFANLICYQLDKGKEVHVCDVGGGFSMFDRITIQKMLDLGLVTKENPLVLEVKANARFERGELRHPTYLRIRDDKPWNQCVIKEAARNGRA